MTTILNSAGIVPSQTKEYTVESIHDAVKSATGANPSIQCIHEVCYNFEVIFLINIFFRNTQKRLGCSSFAYALTRVLIQ